MKACLLPPVLGVFKAEKSDNLVDSGGIEAVQGFKTLIKNLLHSFSYFCWTLPHVFFLLLPFSS